MQGEAQSALFYKAVVLVDPPAGIIVNTSLPRTHQKNQCSKVVRLGNRTHNIHLFHGRCGAATFFFQRDGKGLDFSRLGLFHQER